MPGLLKVWEIIKKLEQARKLVRAKFDGEPVELVGEGRVVVTGPDPAITIKDVTYNLNGQEHTAWAKRSMFEDDGEIIIDGEPVADPDVDIRADMHGIRKLAVKYDLEYEDEAGVLHVLRLYGFVRLF
jgi:hypothetical protein